MVYSGFDLYVAQPCVHYALQRQYADQLQKTELEVEKYNNRIEEIIRSSPFPIIISRLSDDKIILANNNAVKLFGINPRELERYRLKDFFADSDNRQLLNERLEQERRGSRILKSW